jgi:hypothetical protein
MSERSGSVPLDLEYRPFSVHTPAPLVERPLSFQVPANLNPFQGREVDAGKENGNVPIVPK